MENPRVQTYFLPEEGFLRDYQIIGRRAVTEVEASQNRRDAEEARKLGNKPNAKPKRARDAVPALIPISRSAWWDGVANSRYPPAVRHQGVTMWRISDIRKLIKEIETEQEALTSVEDKSDVAA